MAKRTKTAADPAGPSLSPARTRVIYCGDNLEQLKKLPGGSMGGMLSALGEHALLQGQTCRRKADGMPPNRNDEVFWGETKEQRAFQDRHESTKATIEFMRPRAVELARVLKQTGSFYYHCDWRRAGTRLSGQHGPAPESPLTP